MARTTVLAICGSLRADSLNAGLLTAIERRAPGLRLVGRELVAHLPLFNPDADDTGRLPGAVAEFRLLASAAEAVVIASPEYLHAPSGVTKNALDWLVGSLGIVGKPTLLMSASPGETGGIRGLVGLYPTLQLMDAVLVDPVTVSRATSRLRSDGTVLDAALDLRLDIALEELGEAVRFARGRTMSWSVA